MGGNQLPVCAAWNGRKLKISPCSPSFYHHDCTAQFMKLLIVLFSQGHQYHAFCYVATYCQQSDIKCLLSLFLSFFLYLLLSCCCAVWSTQMERWVILHQQSFVVVVVIITTMTFPTCCSLPLNIVLNSMHSSPQTELPKVQTSWLERGFYRLPCWRWQDLHRQWHRWSVCTAAS